MLRSFEVFPEVISGKHDDRENKQVKQKYMEPRRSRNR
jgi:hypothetical protein